MAEDSRVARELAQFMAGVDRKVASLGRAAQVARSTLPIEGADVDVTEAVAAGAEAAVVVEETVADVVDVQEQIDATGEELDAAGEELDAAMEELDTRLADADERQDASEERIADAEERIDEAFLTAEQAKASAPNRVDDPTFTFGDRYWAGSGGQFLSEGATKGLLIGARLDGSTLTPIAETVDRTGTVGGLGAVATPGSTFDLRLEGAVLGGASFTVTFGGTSAAQRVTKTISSAADLVDPIRLVWPSATSGIITVRIQATTSGAPGTPAVITSVSVTDVTALVAVQDAADSAVAAADTAIVAAGEAQATAEGKPVMLFSVNEPSGDAPQGSVWFQVNESKQVVGQWQQEAVGAGDDWEKREVTSEVIANLDVGKLTAGSAAISDLVAQKIAASSGQFLELDVGQLVASDAVLGEAVAQKIWADSTVTRLLTANQIIGGSAIINGSITASKLTLTPGNLVDDPGFSRPLGEIWEPQDFPGSGPMPTIAENSALPGKGLYFGPAASGTRTATNVSRFDVVPGEDYAISWRSTVGMGTGVSWFDADDNRISGTGTVLPTAAGWSDSTMVETAPAGAVYGRVEVWRSTLAGGWIGKVQVRPAVGASLIVDGAIDGKTITGGRIQTAASGTRMLMGPGLSGVHGIWLYDQSGSIRGALTGTTSGEAAVFGLLDANGVQRMNLNETQLRFTSSGDAIRTRLTDSGAQFYNNARIDFYGTSTTARFGYIQREPGESRLTIWGGSEGSNVWSNISMGAASDGALITTQGIRSRTTTVAANMYVGATGNLAFSTSVKAAKIDVTDAESPALLNIAYRSWIDKQAMIDAVLGRADAPTRRVVGAVAEEMEQVAPELCVYDEEGNLSGVAYDRVALALIPILRGLTNRVEALEGAPATVWPASPVYDDTALWDEVTGYGSEEPETPYPTEPNPVITDEEEEGS